MLVTCEIVYFGKVEFLVIEISEENLFCISLVFGLNYVPGERHMASQNVNKSSRNALNIGLTLVGGPIVWHFTDPNLYSQSRVCFSWKRFDNFFKKTLKEDVPRIQK